MLTINLPVRGVSVYCLIECLQRALFGSLFKMTYNGPRLSVSLNAFSALCPHWGVRSILMDTCRIDFELGII